MNRRPPARSRAREEGSDGGGREPLSVKRLVSPRRSMLVLSFGAEHTLVRGILGRQNLMRVNT